MNAALTRLAVAAALAALAPVGFAADQVNGPAHHAAALPLAGDLLYALPPEPAVRRALAALPQLRVGAMGESLALAEQARLVAGPHEWTLSAGTSQRRVTGERRYREQEVAAERGLRWFGKAEQDRDIGAQGVSLAAAQRADDWHEACRTLLRDWYDALRAQSALQRLTEQHALVLQLDHAARLRVAAGDSPALDAMQAETEVRRSEALLEQARQEVAQALALLAATYEQLPAPAPAALPEPPAPDDGAGASDHAVARITDDNHELVLAQATARLQALQARRSASERMPDPTLGIRTTRERDGQERTLGLTLSIPLAGAARSAEADAAAMRARMADERVRQVRNTVLRDARHAVAAQGHSYRIWTNLRQVAEQSARQAQLMARAWQAGESTLGEALLARRQALDAALAAQTAQITALAAAARVQLDGHALWAFD